jgi:hypothetical protein
MTRRYIPVEEAASEWMKDPEFRAAYDALEDEFARASPLYRRMHRLAPVQAPWRCPPP